MVRVEHEDDQEVVLAFTADEAYPFYERLPEREFDAAFRLVDDESDYVIGYLWCHCVDAGSRLWDLHVCVREQWHGLWLSRRLIGEIEHMLALSGVRTLIANPFYADHAYVLMMLGFTPTPVGMVRSIGVQ